MIDRKRVHELAEGKTSKADLARAAGVKPWVEPATTLLRMWTAPTLEEFDRLAKDFPKALRRLRSFMITQRQVPERHNGWPFRDTDFEAALKQLNGAMMDANCGDRFQDREGFARRAALGARFRKLFRNVKFRPK